MQKWIDKAKFNEFFNLISVAVIEIRLWLLSAERRW